MPQSLLACLGPWFQDLMILLESVELEKKMDLPEQEPRLKTWKRVLQLCCNLVSRHRKHVDKYDAGQLFTCIIYLLGALVLIPRVFVKCSEYECEMIASGI